MVIEADALKRCYRVLPERWIKLDNLKKHLIFSLSSIENTETEPYAIIDRVIHDSSYLYPLKIGKNIFYKASNSSKSKGFAAIHDWRYTIAALDSGDYSLTMYPVAIADPTDKNLVSIVFQRDYILNKLLKERYPVPT